MATVLRDCKAKVVLGGYPSPLYDELFKSWRCDEFDTANRAAVGKNKTTDAGMSLDEFLSGRSIG
jgi:hypothetical protein